MTFVECKSLIVRILLSKRIANGRCAFSRKNHNPMVIGL